MGASFTSNRAQVEHALRSKMQTGVMNMAHDVVALSTPVTPFRKGDLRIRRYVTALPNGARIEWLAGHAAVQNLGSRNGHRFRHYTTAGTGPDFVQRGVAAAMANLGRYFK